MSEIPDQPSAPETAPSATESSGRRATVDRAREGWIRRLIDLSRRNNLLFYRDLKTGTLDLSAADPELLAALYSGDSVALRALVPEGEEVRAVAKAQEIRRRALMNLEEKGLETLFVAIGLATWPAPDDGRPAESPILLLPVAIESRGRDRHSVLLRAIGDARVNPVLLHVLETLHGILVSEDRLLPPQGEDNHDTPMVPAETFARLSRVASSIAGFSVFDRAVLGNFSFQKMAMVRDLKDCADAMARHNLIAAIAGDVGARETVRAARTEIDPRDMDRAAPASEFLVLDADSSQRVTVAAALKGQTGIVHGPPGTGKSQTIVNLIASFAAEGRRVLFVAEKRAALDVVLRRLKDVGLAHLALDLHGAEVSRRQVMKRVAEILDFIRQAPPVSPHGVHDGLTDRRTRLNDHATRLHQPRTPSDLAAYDLYGRLLRFGNEPRSTVRWRDNELDRLGRETAGKIKDLLIELQAFGGLFLRDHPSPWTGAYLPDGASVQRALALVARLHTSRWPAFRSALAAVESDTRLPEPTHLDDAGVLQHLLVDAHALLGSYSEDLFQRNLDLLAETIVSASRGPAHAAWAWAVNPRYRSTRRLLIALRHAESAPTVVLLAECRKAKDVLRRWSQRLPNYPPCVATRLQDFQRGNAELAEDIALLTVILRRDDLMRLPLPEVQDLLARLAADTTTPYRLPRLNYLETELERLGAGATVDELRQLKPPAEQWPRFFEHAWLSSCLDRAWGDSPELAGFDGRTHEQFVADFGELDRRHLTLAARRVRRAHAERAVATMNQFPGQADLVQREAAKKSRHLSLRTLLSRAPNVLPAVCPCWMASPLSVSQLLGADQTYFDVVLFDEASQVLPEDAVPAILRASQLVVAGDQNQLPPTMFFVAGDEDEEEPAVDPGSEGFESILDVMSGFLPPWSLDWHYRSRDESLIAFSNHHVYRNRLITFPGPGGPPVLSHVLVDSEHLRDGEEESASAEVRQVVELVLDHATTNPRATLGVIAMGIRHADRIEAAVEEAIASRAELEEFFDQSKSERFFVKNLERVQGDERDAIILSVGYGKDRSGRLLYRFGPLLYEGGERRLNVAVTRARRRMTIVSSFTHHDMDPKRTTARGVELLRLYLQYAATQGKVLGDHGPGGVPLNDFEADVHDALAAKGLRLLAQYGASRYRIDLVAQHPGEPGRFVLAIECDGASYHSSPTARDRDRLRQQHLEALGWRFHRIWSTDWFLRREDEIERTLTAFQSALRFSEKPAQDDECGATDGEPATRAMERDSADASATTSPLHPRPRIPKRGGIGQYRLRELVQLVNWVESDGRVRTDGEIIDILIDELGFQRRGARIEAALRSAILAARARRGDRLF